MKVTQNQLTVDQKLSITVLIAGAGVFLAQIVLSLDPGVESSLWDGTGVTATCHILGAVGVIFTLINFRLNREDWLDLTHREPGGVVDRYQGGLKTSHQGASIASQELNLGRQQNEILRRGRVALLITVTLAPTGMLGTMMGSGKMFAGLKETVASIKPGEAANMDGMVTAFEGMQGALISTIVAMMWGIWIYALNYFNRCQGERFIDQLEKITEPFLNGLLLKIDPATIAIEKLSDLAYANTKQLQVIAGLQDKGNGATTQELGKLYQLLEYKLAGLANLTLQTNEQLEARNSQVLRLREGLEDRIAELAICFKRLVEFFEEADPDHKRFPGLFGEDVLNDPPTDSDDPTTTKKKRTIRSRMTTN